VFQKVQQAYQQIFEMACKELPHKHHKFKGEEYVMYRGFKVSLKCNKFYWQDTRYTDFYEPVDPFITENILIEGFYTTITNVMTHNDNEKVYNISIELFNISEQVKFWVNKSSENWRSFKSQETIMLSNTKLTQDQIEHGKNVFNNKYLEKKNLYIKKRGVLKQEREQLEADKAFYQSRIKSYKN
jgi:hypothetical protein